jgi:MFS family permease
MGTQRPRVALILLVLLGINTMNFYDRHLPGVVAEPLRRELGLSDFQLGLLTPAFLLLYMFMGLPFGHLADRGRRGRLLAVGVTVWSLLTAASGMTWNYASLFLARVGVGVGEASCAPTANSLLGDLFPRERRGRAVSLFMLGLPLGLALSSFVGGPVAGVWGWRAAFYVAAVPGLLLGLACWIMPEPPREVAEGQAPSGSPLWRVLCIPTMWWIILSGALHNFNLYALGTFLTPLLQRSHGLTTGQAGVVNGILYGLGGLGIFLGGWVSDWAVRWRPGGRLEVAAASLVVAFPCIYAGLEQPPNHPLTFALIMLPGCLLLYAYYPAVYAAIQDVVEPSARGTAMAVYFFAMYLLGGAMGPTVIGAWSDRIARQALEAGTVASPEAARAVGLHGAMYLIPYVGVALVVVLVAGARAALLEVRRRQMSLGDTPSA